MRLEGNDSAGNSAGHSIEISIIYRLSKSVPFSLITPYQNLNFLALEPRIPIWLLFKLKLSVKDIDPTLQNN